MESGDQPMAPKPPDQGSGEVELVRGKGGDSQEEVRLSKGLIDNKDAEKQREMKKGKEKEGKKKKKGGKEKEKGKKKEKRSKASGWCTKFINCFACGAFEQDEPEEVEMVSVEARQTPQDEKQSQKDGLHSSTANEDENGNKEGEPQEVVKVPVEAGQKAKDEQSQKGDLGSSTHKKVKSEIDEEREAQRGGKTEHFLGDWTPTSTLFKRLKVEMDSWERSNEQHEDEKMNNSFNRLQRMVQRRKKVIEANEEWLSLPFKSHDGIKVAFYDDDDFLCDIWYFEEEPMPKLKCRKWMSVLDEIEQRRKKARKAIPKGKCPKWLRLLDEIRQKKVEEEEENMSTVALQEELMEEEEEEKEEDEEKEEKVVLLKERKEDHGVAMRMQNAAARVSEVLLLLAVGVALCVSLWF